MQRSFQSDRVQQEVAGPASHGASRVQRLAENTSQSPKPPAPTNTLPKQRQITSRLNRSKHPKGKKLKQFALTDVQEKYSHKSDKLAPQPFLWNV